jgi:CheY-like chemotaxis protein
MAIALPNILISDDDVEFRETLRGLFEPQGYRTIVAGDGEEAVEIVRSEPIHIVLLDLHMPKLSGLEVLQLIKQFNALLPCILMSAGLDEVVRRQAEPLAFSVLAKPVSGSHVRHLVEAAMRLAYGIGDDVPESDDYGSRCA